MICKICGALLTEGETCQQLCDKLSFYTLNHAGSEYFIHQLVVDAYAAQHAKLTDKLIRLAFSLVGLYLFAEKGYTGREVQLAHMQLTKERHEYPKFNLPKDRGKITVGDVLKVREGSDRDQMIKSWAKSVWQAFIDNRPEVINLLAEVKFYKFGISEK